MRKRASFSTPDGTNWYYEQEGIGPHVVLIPDGIGDCYMFDKPMSLIASYGFTVTTFDMPGMSRSSRAPPETYHQVTAQALAGCVVSLLDGLGIDEASFWGSSSGGATVLALLQKYSERVRNAMPHEVPTSPGLGDALAGTDDDELAARCHTLFTNIGFIEQAAWDGLGKEFHERVARNYPRWARGYKLVPASAPTDEETLKKRPLDWTVGATTSMGVFFDNVVTATRAGVNITCIPSAHFPYVSEPEAFAKHVVDTCSKYI
jgi:pimeloyl-ACP methyl ester carboxylesterase